jgi:hypothetical protein
MKFIVTPLDFYSPQGAKNKFNQSDGVFDEEFDEEYDGEYDDGITISRK